MKPETENNARPTIKMLPFILRASGLLGFLLCVFAMMKSLIDRLADRQPGQGPLLLTILIPIGLTLLVGIGATIVFRRRAQLIRDGVDVLAEVTKIGTFEYKGMRDISFQYEHNGQSHRIRKSLNARDVSKLRVGDRFRILVLPINIRRYVIVNTDPVHSH